MKINLLFAFHPWFCGCSCILPVLVHTSHLYYVDMCNFRGLVKSLNIAKKEYGSILLSH